MMLAGDGMKMQRALRIVMPLLLVLSLLLVVTPRFNRMESGLLGKITSKGDVSSEKIGDAKYYITYVEWFRGEGVTDLIAPWSCRLMSPAIASLLPFDPMTSLNVVNIVALLVALMFLYLILGRMKFGYWWRIIGCFLFVFSFPVFYYGTIGYVDPVVICFLMIGTYFVLAERWVYLFVTIILGTLAKEAIVVLIPFIVMYLMVKRFERGKQVRLIVAYCLAFAVTYLLIKVLNPGVDDYTRLPNMENTMLNLTRPRAYQGFVLSFGIPGFLSLFALRHVRKDSPPGTIALLGPFVAGLITAFLLYVYSFISAYADGRIIWTAYPFTVPLAIFVLKGFVERRTGHKPTANDVAEMG